MEKSILLKILKSNDFDTEEALKYCAGSEHIYMEVLKSAYEEGQEKIPLLQQCLNSSDIDRYQIEVHGLKNVAQTIGATQLYKQTVLQNEAAKAGNLEQVLDGQEKLIAIYQQTLNSIESALEDKEQ